MTRGSRSFLTTRPTEEAWDTVLKVLREVEFVQRKAAIRLGVHEKTLRTWLQKHELVASVNEERAKMLAERVG